jgi:hypothetical protein
MKLMQVGEYAYIDPKTITAIYPKGVLYLGEGVNWVVVVEYGEKSQQITCASLEDAQAYAKELNERLEKEINLP